MRTAGTPIGARPPSALPGSTVAVVAALSIAVVARGGTSAPSQWAIGALLVAGLGAAAAGGRLERGAWLRPGVVAAVLLAAWSLVRAAAAGDVTLGAGTAAVIAGAVVTYLLVASEAATGRRLIVDVLLGLGTLLAASGWAGVAFRWEPLAIPAAGLWRAATLLTYANAAAAVLAMLALVALARLAARQGLAGSWVAMLLILGLLGTLSRAGAAAFAAGLVVLAYQLGLARLAGAVLAPAAGAAVAFGGTLPALGQFTAPQPALALAGLAGGTVVTAALAARRRPVPLRRAVVLVGAAAVAVLAVGVATGGLDGRLSLVPADRVERNQAALEMFTTAPLAGVGPGPLWVTWEDAAGRVHGGWHVHNEYVELLVELGLAGAALLGVLLVGVALRLRRSRPISPLPAAWAGVAAAVTALALHSALDFLWHVPAIPLLAATLLGTADPSTNEGANS